MADEVPISCYIINVLNQLQGCLVPIHRPDYGQPFDPRYEAFLLNAWRQQNRQVEAFKEKLCRVKAQCLSYEKLTKELFRFVEELDNENGMISSAILLLKQEMSEALMHQESMIKGQADLEEDRLILLERIKTRAKMLEIQLNEIKRYHEEISQVSNQTVHLQSKLNNLLGMFGATMNKKFSVHQNLTRTSETNTNTIHGSEAEEEKESNHFSQELDAFTSANADYNASIERIKSLKCKLINLNAEKEKVSYINEYIRKEASGLSKIWDLVLNVCSSLKRSILYSISLPSTIFLPSSIFLPASFSSKDSDINSDSSEEQGDDSHSNSESLES